MSPKLSMASHELIFIEPGRLMEFWRIRKIQGLDEKQKWWFSKNNQIVLHKQIPTKLACCFGVSDHTFFEQIFGQGTID